MILDSESVSIDEDLSPEKLPDIKNEHNNMRFKMNFNNAELLPRNAHKISKINGKDKKIFRETRFLIS